MKKLLIGLPMAALLMTSCGGGEAAEACDYSTAEGVAECYCQLESAYDAAKEADDDAKKKELKAKKEEMEQEAEKHMDAGDYTENEIEKFINETCEAH